MIIEIPDNEFSIKDLVKLAAAKGLALKSGFQNGRVTLRMVRQEEEAHSNGSNFTAPGAAATRAGLPDCVVLDVQPSLPDSVHLSTERKTISGRVLEFSNAFRRRQVGATPKATF